VSAFVISANAQATPKPASDMTVFGLTLGEPLSIPECPKSGDTSYKSSATVCYRLNAFDGDKLDDVNRYIIFPFNDSPSISKFNVVPALVLDGKLEGIGFNTNGTQNDEAVLEKLKEKYGEPTTIKRGTVQNRLGATFNKFTAIWLFSNLYVGFQSVTTKIDSGLVNIDTTKGFNYREAKLKELTKDKRPL